MNRQEYYWKYKQDYYWLITDDGNNILGDVEGYETKEEAEEAMENITEFCCNKYVEKFKLIH